MTAAADGSDVGKPGATREQLEEAVLRSGYPLQGMVVDRLLEAISEDVDDAQWVTIQEEWSFIDKETDAVRNIDALLGMQLTKNDNSLDDFSDPSSWLRVHINFLVECKQSDLPYVAFTRDTARTCRLPLLFGLPNEEIEIRNFPDEEGFTVMPAGDVLGTWDVGMPRPGLAVSIAKFQRRGKILELSGEETYRGIVLPILKAVEYLKERSIPSSQRMYHDIRVVFPIAVVRAQLIEAKVQNGEVDLKDVPWVRVLRSEPRPGHGLDFPELSGFDVVQYDHLLEYAEAAKKAATEIMSRIADFSTQLITGIAVYEMDEEKEEEEFPYRDFLPHLSGEKFGEWLHKKFVEVHENDE